MLERAGRILTQGLAPHRFVCFAGALAVMTAGSACTQGDSGEQGSAQEDGVQGGNGPRDDDLDKTLSRKQHLRKILDELRPMKDLVTDCTKVMRAQRQISLTYWKTQAGRSRSRSRPRNACWSTWRMSRSNPASWSRSGC